VTTTPASPATSQQAAVDAALLVLKSMGLSLDDLLSAGSANRRPVPTFAEYVPVVAATLTGSTLRAYSSYWKRTVDQWGDRRLDEPTPSEVKQLAAYVKANAVQRRNSRGGGHAAENLISALRCLYNHAVDDGLIAEKDNPARKIDKPRRLPSTRQALDGPQLAEINRVVTTAGNDPELDALIVRLHTETACRRGGALALRPRDLDREQCLILLREKGETFRWQPVSPTLMAGLVQHAEDRNAPSDGGLQAREADYLRFARDLRVPMDNNEAERAIRMSKLRIKVSGSMRSMNGAEIFCAIRSYLATAAHHEISTLGALTRALQGNPWIPETG
jgi:integrase/recombinase XerC